MRSLQIPGRQAARVARFACGSAGLFVLAVVAWGLVVAVVPAAALRWKAVVVSSASMAPALRPGDLVIAQPTDRPSDGMVAVFRAGQPTRLTSVRSDGDTIRIVNALPDHLTTHRITATNDDGSYETKGDANLKPDSDPIRAVNMVGAGRIRVPYLGIPILWLRSGDWAPLALAVMALVVSARLARYAVDPRFDPWAAPQAAQEPESSGRRTVRPWFAATSMIGATLIIVPLHAAPANAAFSDTTANGGQNFTAATTFCPGTVILTPTADAAVLKEDPNDTHGALTWLGVRGDAIYDERSYLRFPLPSVPSGCNVLSAELKLTTNEYLAGRTHRVRLAAAGWNEATITWNNQPGITGPTVSRPSTATTQTWDVTPHIAASSPTNNGLVVVDSAESTGNFDWQEYRSRESATPPELTVVYG
ncbi:MAG: S24/S26 family peptidase [Microthrixaceae bacterium]|nr:S24/S26 family peptidase [Microthrixaceae bacterium]